MQNNITGKKIICIICPQSCECEVNNGEVIGAKCRRGVKFCLQEIVMPLRTITTTVKCITAEGSQQVPVKTERAVPLAEISNIMGKIKRLELRERPELGVVIEHIDILGDIKLVVTG